ncbi:MAG: MFS transporter, partial [Candidatus Omnitrophica bacterium]|nr:MFS transporter [Candidatus Omnitrophota bacterium]
VYWVPTYMYEVQGVSIANAATKSILFPLAGAAGALTAGWATDKFFASRRTPIIVLMAVLAGIFILLYPRIPVGNNFLSLLCLAIIGFMAFGAHTTMVTVIPMDYGTRKAAASAAGFIDALGYVGATIAGVGTGWLVDNYGWNPAFYFWAAAAFIAPLPMLRLWKYSPPKTKYM